MVTSTYLKAAALVLISALLYIFSPQAGVVNNQTSSSQSKIINLVIKSRVLTDQKSGNINVNVGTQDILNISTDENGRVNLNSSKKNIFNPVFTNMTNTLTIPTDQPNTYTIVFYPNVDPGQPAVSVTIGKVTVNK
jgi:hypothetical protein